MEKQLEIIDFGLDDDGMLGMTALGVVSTPAIQVDFVALKAIDSHVKVVMKAEKSSTGNERRMLYGPVAIPDQLILRKKKDGTEYYMRLSREVIAKMSQDFMKKNLHHTINLEHELPVTGCTVVELWLSEDPELDKSVALGITGLPAGTMYAGMHVENETVWEEAKAGTVNGFSLEANFQKLSAISADRLSEDELLLELHRILSGSVE